MNEIEIKELKIKLPQEIYDLQLPKEHIVEWLEYVLGQNNLFSNSNPLISLELNYCDITIGSLLVDGDKIVSEARL